MRKLLLVLLPAVALADGPAPSIQLYFCETQAASRAVPAPTDSTAGTPLQSVPYTGGALMPVKSFHETLACTNNAQLTSCTVNHLYYSPNSGWSTEPAYTSYTTVAQTSLSDGGYLPAVGVEFPVGSPFGRILALTSSCTCAVQPFDGGTWDGGILNCIEKTL